MKLKEICELADACGLETVGEAVMNAELHYDALVKISDFDEEFEELYREVKALDPDWESKSIYDIVERQCCENCALRYEIRKWSYSDGQCEHTTPEGYICMAAADERTAIWMVGLNSEVGMCEAFVSKNKPKTNWDQLRTLSAVEFGKEFWRILKRAQEYTDSVVWLHEWLMEEAKEDG